MAESIEIGGKLYKAKFFSLLVFQKVLALEKKMEAQAKEEKWEEYAKTWLGYVGTQLEGDVSELATDKISPGDGATLNSFFLQQAAETIPKSLGGNKTSEDTK